MAPTYTNSQIIAQIDSGVYWTQGSTTIASTITYGITTSSSWAPTGYGEYSGWSALNAKQASAATQAFELWDDLIATDLNAAGDPNSADIRISNTSTNISYAHAYFPGETNVDGFSWQKIAGSIWLNPSYSSLADPDSGEYGNMAILHEIGHALGLNHPGTYNGGSPTYANDAIYEQDTHMYTVMSYFDAENTGADWYDANGYWHYAQTPMLHDILTIQAIYDADYETRSSDTVYGFNSTAGHWLYDFSQNLTPVLTIWDGAGNDTLDLSGWTYGSTVSLVPGTFTDGNAMTYNIAIAYDAWIENAIGGSGNDTLIGNDLANELQGGGGNDSLDGGIGDDWLDGGLGFDILIGGFGDDMLLYDAADNLAFLDGGIGFDTLVFTDTLTVFDLVGHGLEQSLVIQTDFGGQIWDQIYDYYDVLDRQTQQDIMFDDNTTQVTLWDVDDIETWSEIISLYDAAGTLISETIVQDAGGGGNQAPTDLNLSAASIEENSNDGTVVGTLSAIDPDSGETFTYSLLNDAGGRFAVQGNQIVVADGSLLDYEAATSHSVTVQVTDSANNTYNEVFTINLTDVDDTGPGNQAPTDLNLSAASIEENSNDGTVIGTLSAIDPDSGETFTYSLLNDAGGRFAVQGNQIVVADGSLLDYETATSHSVTVQVTDSANNTYNEIFTINLTDADDTGTGSGITLTGTTGKDSLVGTDYDDVLFGDAGRDKLRGLDGDDRLEGGGDRDVMFGGLGNDTFVFADGAGNDVIRDYVDGADLLEFFQIDNASEFGDLTISNNGTTNVSVGYTDDLGVTNNITVLSNTAFTLDASDFDFVI